MAGGHGERNCSLQSDRKERVVEEGRRKGGGGGKDIMMIYVLISTANRKKGWVM